jgi:hypothetical protein
VSNICHRGFASIVSNDHEFDLNPKGNLGRGIGTLHLYSYNCATNEKSDEFGYILVSGDEILGVSTGAELDAPSKYVGRFLGYWYGGTEKLNKFNKLVIHGCP